MAPPAVADVAVAVEDSAGIVAGNFDRHPYLTSAEEEAVAAAVDFDLGVLLENYSMAGP